MRIRYQVTLAITAVLWAVAAAPASAQQPTPGAADPGGSQLVDRIAAVVGDSVILLSEVDEQMFREVQANPQMQMPQDPTQQEQLRQQVLDRLIDQHLLLQEAAQDTLVEVSEDRVQQVVEEEMAFQMQEMGGEDQLRTELEAMGQTLSGYRDSLADEVRMAFMLEQFMQIQMQNGADSEIDEQELQEFYEEHRDQFDERPATMSIHRVILEQRASDEARQEALERAEELRERIMDGEPFEEVARAQSDDPDSRDDGGELGWFRRGDPELLEELEDAAFNLSEGQMGPVVESALGAHIVRVDRQRGGERLIRHILVATEVTDEDRERTMERAQEVRSRLEAGESAEDLAEEFSTVDLPTLQEFRVEQIQQLPEEYAREFLNPQTGEVQVGAGDVVGPISVDHQGQETYAVLYVNEVREEGEWKFEDVRDDLAMHMSEEQIQASLVEGLRDKYYVDNRLTGNEP